MAENPATTLDVNETAKKVYDKVIRLEPKKKLRGINRFKYNGDRVGSDINSEVDLTEDQGFTFGGTSTARINVYEAEAAVSEQASGTPVNIYLKTEITHPAATRTFQAGLKAFENLIRKKMRQGKRRFEKLIESLIWYGGSPMAEQTSAAEDTSTTATVTLTPAEWAPLFFRKATNMPLDFYDSTTQLNTVGSMIVTSVTMSPTAPLVGIKGAAADIDAIVAAGADTDIYFRDQYGKDFTGIYSIANLTSSSSAYLGIDPATYPDVWTGQQGTWTYGNTLKWEDLANLLEEAAGKGMEGTVCADCSLKAWNDLNADLAALRVFDSSYKPMSADVGNDVEGIVFHTITGKVKVMPNDAIKRGHVIISPDPADPDHEVVPERTGSQNITSQDPKGNEMWDKNNDTNSFEMRWMTDQFLWAPCPYNFAVLQP